MRETFGGGVTQDAVDGSIPCRPLPPALATLRSFAGSTVCGGPHYMCVGAGEEESLMSVRPAPRVGRFPVRSTHLDDFTLTPGVSVVRPSTTTWSPTCARMGPPSPRREPTATAQATQA